MDTRIAVIYYSATGNIHLLAKALAEGAAERGCDVRLRRVQENAPKEVIEQNARWAEHLARGESSEGSELADFCALNLLNLRAAEVALLASAIATVLMGRAIGSCWQGPPNFSAWGGPTCEDRPRPERSRDPYRGFVELPKCTEHNHVDAPRNQLPENCRGSFEIALGGPPLDDDIAAFNPAEIAARRHVLSAQQDRSPPSRQVLRREGQGPRPAAAVRTAARVQPAAISRSRRREA
jgi:hypothetical protein